MASATRAPNNLSTFVGQWVPRLVSRSGSIDHSICSCSSGLAGGRMVLGRQAEPGRKVPVRCAGSRLCAVAGRTEGDRSQAAGLAPGERLKPPAGADTLGRSDHCDRAGQEDTEPARIWLKAGTTWGETRVRGLATLVPPLL